MMKARSNKVKNKTPFKKWIDEKSFSEKESYLQTNFIPEDISYEFKDFMRFFNQRKQLMKEELIQLLLNDE